MSKQLKGKCITKFSRQFVETAVEYGLADKLKLLHYDILKDREQGKTLSQIAIKRGINVRSVSRILNSYKNH
jgi:DNA invertase Pin-like site-specific DNA recombinase